MKIVVNINVLIINNISLQKWYKFNIFNNNSNKLRVLTILIVTDDINCNWQ